MPNRVISSTLWAMSNVLFGGILLLIALSGRDVPAWVIYFCFAGIVLQSIAHIFQAVDCGSENYKPRTARVKGGKYGKPN